MPGLCTLHMWFFVLKRSCFASLDSSHALSHLSNYSKVSEWSYGCHLCGVRNVELSERLAARSFFLPFHRRALSGSPEGPSMTAAALSLGLLHIEWHNKLMGKCLRLTFLCACVTGARWPADCLCQRLTGPLLVMTRNIPLALSQELSHAPSENKLALRNTS